MTHVQCQKGANVEKEAVCRQDMLYKDYTTNSIFGSKVALPIFAE